MKNKCVITWLDKKFGTDSFRCTSLRGAFRIMEKRRKDRMKRVVWYNEYGILNELYRAKNRIVQTAIDTIDIPVSWWKRLINFLKNLVK